MESGNLSSGVAPLLSAAAPTPLARYLALIRGHDRRWTALLFRWLLWFASLGYGLAVRLHRLMYDFGWRRIHRVSVPVVSVGNLTVGGTGKTPCVEYVCRFYRDREQLVAILSRGYGTDQGPNDEALVLEENLPDVPHLQGSDRAVLAQTAIEELESEVLILDDGMQHRRLARDIELVLIDATDPWGQGHLLPRGLLREPRSSLRRAHGILLTRCDQVTLDVLQNLRKEIQRIAPGRICAEVVHQPQTLMNSNGLTESIERLREHPVAAFCGIGNPDAFRRTLQDLGATVVDFQTYPDHHTYTREDVEELARRASDFPVNIHIVTTQKDLVKLRIDNLGGRSLWALRIALTFRSGQTEIESLLESVLASRT